jgi:hypothetical protein
MFMEVFQLDDWGRSCHAHRATLNQMNVTIPALHSPRPTLQILRFTLYALRFIPHASQI